MNDLTTRSEAQRAVDACGGINETARIIGRHRSVVNRWLLAKENGGTGGRVPEKHWRKLIQEKPELSALFLADSDVEGKAA